MKSSKTAHQIARELLKLPDVPVAIKAKPGNYTEIRVGRAKYAPDSVVIIEQRPVPKPQEE